MVDYWENCPSSKIEEKMPERRIIYNSNFQSNNLICNKIYTFIANAFGNIKQSKYSDQYDLKNIARLLLKFGKRGCALWYCSLEYSVSLL